MSRKCVKSNTPQECLTKWREACGIGPVKVRPGSISEFMVLHGEAYIKSRSSNPDTFNRYSTAWEKRVGPAFGHYQFGELTAEVIQQGLTLGASGSTQQTDKIVLSHLVRLAVVMGVCPPHVPALLSFARLKKREAKDRQGMAEVAENLYAAAVTCGSWLAGPIWAMKTLGLRKGEICGLKPTDLRGNVLTLERQRNHTQGERSGLKGAKKRRKIGLPDALAEQLRSYHRPGTIYLFTRHDGSPLPYQHLDREIEQIIKAAPGTVRATVHDFRAASICNLIAAGASDQQIAEIVGHNSTDEIRHYRDEDVARTRATLSTVVPKG